MSFYSRHRHVKSLKTEQCVDVFSVVSSAAVNTTEAAEDVRQCFTVCRQVKLLVWFRKHYYQTEFCRYVDPSRFWSVSEPAMVVILDVSGDSEPLIGGCEVFSQVQTNC